ncbi:phosphosulfolactate synthase (plasmid) [Natrinema zhouii]|uniref:phosphosulfolactate synthase n=1 Tax=Natrinema zhouii TaxID=1710539 RepID=UPI001E3FE30B|nr:phosphosulfolactate synthase [Natrinema zhouii]UHQ98876.1 phosphosulfolactate synthase [Natrinema zhouii]
MVHEDETRYSLDRVKIEETIERFERFLDAGCEAIYWEGMVVRNLIGRDLAYREGQKALLEVAEAVGPENIVFEIWSSTMNSLEYAKFWSWLVYQFGPSVNVGNVPPRRVPRLQSIRRGTTFDMNHAYIRWLREGKPTDEWWRMEVPPYDVGLERD